MTSVRFDIATMPLSCRGSWLSVSAVLSEHERSEQLHLISHRNGRHPVFSMTVLDVAGAVDCERAAEPSVLSWLPSSAATGEVRLAFAGPGVIRIRGRELGFRFEAVAAALTPFSGTYAVAVNDDTVVFTSYETGHRYQVLTVSGCTTVQGDQALGTARRGVTVPPGQQGWELEITESRVATASEAPRADFDTVVATARSAFDEFAASMLPAGNRDATAVLACYLLWSSVVEPAGRVRRPSILMSKHWMDKVWAWDPCFNALALAAGQPDLAWHQFLAMFDHQDASGALPDSVAHSEVLYNFVKPPVHGWAFTLLRRDLGRELTGTELRQAYDALSRWSDFWLTHRRIPGSVLCHYEHGNDSGWDNSTVFAAERMVQSADLAALLALQLDTVADLAEELGLVAQSERRRGEAAQQRAALLDVLWDGTAFRARGARSGRLRTSASLLDLIPIVLGTALPPDVRTQLVERLLGHLEPAGLATERTDSVHYEADGYWRGPVWAPPTVLIVHGLRQLGETGLAATITARFAAACAGSGFAENFDAVTGQGLRDRAYTWTASGYLILNRQPRPANAGPGRLPIVDGG